MLPGLCPSRSLRCAAIERAEGHGWRCSPHHFLCGFVRLSFCQQLVYHQPACCCSKLWRPEGKCLWSPKSTSVALNQPCGPCWQPLALRGFWGLHYRCAICYGWIQVKELPQRPDHPPSLALVVETPGGDEYCKKSMWVWGFQFWTALRLQQVTTRTKGRRQQVFAIGLVILLPELQIEFRQNLNLTKEQFALVADFITLSNWP